jgi:hypothetical protein
MSRGGKNPAGPRMKTTAPPTYRRECRARKSIQEKPTDTPSHNSSWPHWRGSSGNTQPGMQGRSDRCQERGWRAVAPRCGSMGGARRQDFSKSHNDLHRACMDRHGETEPTAAHKAFALSVPFPRMLAGAQNEDWEQAADRESTEPAHGGR